MTTTTAALDIAHLYIPLSSIDVSATNPRRHFDSAKLEELRGSILRHGVLQPILVRPKGESRYELVAGERRFRATRDAGLDDIPAIVRELDDKQALEIQVVENLQRADLHPLEEAEGYVRLTRDFGYIIDELAVKIGKSRSYVYGRMKLAELCPSAKKALEDDTITHSVALLIARIPDTKLQEEATKRIVGNRRSPMSYREAFDFVQHDYMLRLQDAPFDRKDATLLAAAGPCTTCQFRTGNQKELFGDVKSADVCTKPTCYRSKLDAHWARIQETAKSKGLRILPPSEEKKVFEYGRLNTHSGAYVQPDSKVSYESKKTFRSALGKKLPQITVARNPQSGEIHELIPRQVAVELLQAAGVLKKERDSGGDYRAQQKREAEKRKLERAVEASIIDETRPKLTDLEMTTDLVRIVTKAVCFGRASYGMDSVFKRRGLKYPEWTLREKAITKFVDALPETECALVCAELLLTFGNLEARSAGEKDLVRQLAKLVGVDDVAIEKRIRSEAAEKQRAKGKKAKKKAASGTCRECGCTDQKACEGGCTWLDRAKTLCSSCEVAT